MDNQTFSCTCREAREIQQSLTEMAQTGPFDVRELDRALRTQCEPPGWPTESVGATWILRHTELFLANVPYVGAFLRRHFDTEHCTELLLTVPGVVEAIRDDQRDQFVLDAYVKNGALNNDWVKVAVEAGVNQDVIAEAIIRRLQGVVEQRGMLDEGRSFLEFGHDSPRGGDAFQPPDDPEFWSFSPDTAWGVLGDRLTEALEVCADRVPMATMTFLCWVQRALGAVEAQRIAVIAASKLNSAAGVDKMVMRVLSLAERQRLCQGLSADDFRTGISSFEVVIETLAETPAGQQGAFWASILPVLERVPYPVDGLQVALQYGEPARLLEKVFRATLQKQSYVVGRLKTGRYFDRRSGRHIPQLQLWDGARRTAFVQNRSQLSDGRHFQVGDLVAVYSASARQLSNRRGKSVKAADFRLLQSARAAES